ncbi:MAG: DUF342 domain-containing protein [Desulfatitalea sp.]|nr:DUF342 domain-containing protein [Desulfatitalea sp.]NNJ99688.1 DUF342 domain-containing protein [Desulfatitalea sp.]
MSENAQQDKKFGTIAVERQLLTQEKLDRALVIQRCIITRTKVHLPIGAVLQKMGLLSSEQVEQVLAIQNGSAPPTDDASADRADIDETACDCTASQFVELTVSTDKLTASISPLIQEQAPPSLDDVKLLLLENDIDYGVVSDNLLSAHLEKNPMPPDSFVVARGKPPVPGTPPEIRYYFDTDPLRIGTLLEDGTMDWKNRGEIPQVRQGDLLAEKVGGTKGEPGINIHGQEIKPPRVKEHALKCTKGAERSEDKTQVLAKVNGTPKLSSDGRIGVFGVLPIESDIGIETGNIEFEGHIEVDGGVCSGYRVKGGSLNTREIQSAHIEIENDLVSYGGVYNSTITVGGHFKASHIHNCTVEVLGDLIVEKEIFGCTIEVNGRCLVESGKIIGSKISAKKGIQTKDIGTRAARPSELTVGVDFKYTRDVQAAKAKLDDLGQRKENTTADIVKLKTRIDELDAQLGTTAQEQDHCMVQKRELENRLKNPAESKNPKKRALIEGLIQDLAVKYEALDQQVHRIMAQDDTVRNKIAQHKKDIEAFEVEIQEIEENLSLMEEAAKVDPGVPVVKASGMVYAKTSVTGPHKKIIIPKEMQCVRIAEGLEDGNRYQMKISSVR